MGWGVGCYGVMGAPREAAEGREPPPVSGAVGYGVGNGAVVLWGRYGVMVGSGGVMGSCRYGVTALWGRGVMGSWWVGVQTCGHAVMGLRCYGVTGLWGHGVMGPGRGVMGSQ